MKKYLIDTNCLISFITDRNPKQQEIIAKYINEAADMSCELLLVDSVITEVVYVLEKIYNTNTKIISNILQSLTETPGITAYRDFDLSQILKLWPDKIRDYVDAVIASVAAKEKLKVITFDQEFAKQLSGCKISVEDLNN
jgi:predicted nucleic-acid-binding protein